MTPAGPRAECVINISEGRTREVTDSVAAAAGACLLDLHSDAEHHRSVLTLGGDLDQVAAAARAVAASAVARIDLSTHRGVHPRMGAVDVVPFVPLPGPDGTAGDPDAVVAARDEFAAWMGGTLGVPCFLYGPERTLPEVRRHAFAGLAPDVGPPVPHPTAGACAVGARGVLIAYNVWIRPSPGVDGPDADGVVAVARSLAGALRRPGLRTLGLAVDGGAQVSCNVVDPDSVRLDVLYDDVARGATAHGCSVWRGELVGLLPRSALAAVPGHRWSEVGLQAGDTIEFRLGDRLGDRRG